MRNPTFDNFLENLHPQARVYWACAYPCPQGVDGRSYHLIFDGDDVDNACIFTVGCGENSVEYWMTLSSLDADAVGLALDEPGRTPDESLLWLGPSTSLDLSEYGYETCGITRLQAVALETLGALLEAHIALLRPDVETRPDSEWLRHDNVVELVRSRVEGAAAVATTFAELVEFVEVEQQRVQSASQRQQQRLEQSWLSWTDGTFIPHFRLSSANPKGY